MLPSIKGRGFAKASDGDVILKMSMEDYQWILFAIGYFTGGLSKENPRATQQALGLINRINMGNEEFTPYQLEKDKKTK